MTDEPFPLEVRVTRLLGKQSALGCFYPATNGMGAHFDHRHGMLIACAPSYQFPLHSSKDRINVLTIEPEDAVRVMRELFVIAQ